MHLKIRKYLRQCSATVVQEQVEAGTIRPTRLRNRRRFFSRQIRQQLSPITLRSPELLQRATIMLLAAWGLACTTPADIALAVTPQASFQHQILDGFKVSGNATPRFADIDGDGDLDAFIGSSSGAILFYRNNGIANLPVFSPDAAGNPMAAFNVGINASPAFADIDFDGDLDLFVGLSSGAVAFYRNNGTNNTPRFAASGPTTNPLAGVTAGTFASPTLSDIDGDGDLDAFIGNGYGSIIFYRNNGTAAAPLFVADLAGNPLGGATTTGYAAPTLADIDGDGDLDAFIGQATGGVLFYRNNGSATYPTFTADPVNNPLVTLTGAVNSSPALLDIDADGDLDAFIGNKTGTVSLYRNSGSITAPVLAGDTTNNPMSGFNAGFNAAPVFADIDFDGDPDAFIGTLAGTVAFYRNSGTAAAPNFIADSIGNPLASVAVLKGAAPSLADIDGDGDLDAVIGNAYGTLQLYRNNGTASSPLFAADTLTNPLSTVAIAAGYSTPTFSDIDADGDLDAFIGNASGTTLFYRNNGGSRVPVFVADTVSNPLAAVALTYRTAPAFIDIDNDGDQDAFIATNNGTAAFYRNNGSAIAPLFNPDPTGNPLAGFNVGYSSAAPAFTDIDNDGDPDLFIGTTQGAVKFFANQAFQPLALPANAGNLKIGVLTSGANIASVSLAAATPANPPAGQLFPFGQIRYNVNTALGGTVTVRMIFPSALPAGFTLYKIDLANNYTIIPANRYTLLGNTSLDLSLTDGGPYDLDGVANTVIVDPVAVAQAVVIIPPVTPLPVTPAPSVPVTQKTGGCSINPTAGFDPSLLLMMLLSLWHLFRRTPVRAPSAINCPQERTH